MNDHDRALAILDRDGWTQGSSIDVETGGRCVMGCYSQAMVELLGRADSARVERVRRTREAVAELVQALELTAPTGGPRYLTANSRAIVSWNDAEDRFDADIREGLKKASELHNSGA